MAYQDLLPWAMQDAQRDETRRQQWSDAQRQQTIAQYMATANQIRRQQTHLSNLQTALALITDHNKHQPAAGQEAEAARLKELIDQFNPIALQQNLDQVQGYIQKLYDPNFNAQTGMEARSPIRALGEKLHLVKPQGQTPQTAGELIKGLRGIQQKYDVAAPGIETGEQELAGAAAERAQERTASQQMDFIAAEGKRLGWSEDEIQAAQGAAVGAPKPTAAKKPTAVQGTVTVNGVKKPVVQEIDETGGISLKYVAGGGRVPDEVADSFQLTGRGAGAGANLKEGTFGAFLKSAYGDNPTPQQTIDARRIWAEAASIQRTSTGEVIWTDADENSFKIPVTRTTGPVPSGLTPPVPYQPPATPGPIQIGVGGQTFTGQQGAGAPVVQSITPTGSPQVTPGAASATGATDVTTAPQSSMSTTGPRPPVAGAQFVGHKRSPEQTAAVKAADLLETDATSANAYMQERRAGRKSATADTSLVFSWVRAEVRGAGRISTPEIEMNLKSGSYGTRFSNAYNKAVSGTLDDNFVEQMVADINRNAKATRQTADKYKSGGTSGDGSSGIVPKGTTVYDPSGKSYKADGTHPLPQGWSTTPPGK